jgi:hypothetical protein
MACLQRKGDGRDRHARITALTQTGGFVYRSVFSLPCTLILMLPQIIKIAPILPVRGSEQRLAIAWITPRW